MICWRLLTIWRFECGSGGSITMQVTSDITRSDKVTPVALTAAWQTDSQAARDDSRMSETGRLMSRPDVAAA